MEYTKNRVPLFNGNNYALWSGRMQVHLLAQGYGVWEIVEKGFALTQDEQGKKNMLHDAKAKDLIMSGLIESIYLKVLSCKTAKERVDETKNTLEGLGELVETKIVVRKILRTLPTRFNPKVSILEDRSNLTNLSVDELHGILTTYEMRIEEEDDTSHLETTFVASKKNTKDKQTPKAKTCNCKDEDREEFSNKEFAYFTWKMKTSTRKFKGKLPLICFDCGEVGNFAAKCPHKNELLRKE
eukprot:PITA_02313